MNWSENKSSWKFVERNVNYKKSVRPVNDKL